MNTLKFTAERKAEYVKAFEATGELMAAAAAVGFGRQTIYDHLNKDPDFADACEQARGRLYGRLMSTLEHLALEGTRTDHYGPDGTTKTHSTFKHDTKLLLAWLKRIKPAAWSDRVQIDQTITTKVEQLNPSDMPAAARSRFRDALAALPASSTN